MEGICICGYTKAEHIDANLGLRCPKRIGSYIESQEEAEQLSPGEALEVSIKNRYITIAQIEEQIESFMAHCANGRVTETLVTERERQSLTIIFEHKAADK